MLLTLFYVLFFLARMIIPLTLGIVLLRWGLQWSKVQSVTLRRVILALILALALKYVFLVFFRHYLSQRHLPMVVELLGVLFGVITIPCIVITRLFKTRPIQSFRAYLPVWLVYVFIIPVSLFVIRPYIVEKFRISTCGMAPTILGYHYEGQCTECGNPSFGSVMLGGYKYKSPMTICQGNFHVSHTKDNERNRLSKSERVCGPDRILVAKFLKPKRWDVIVFRNPENPRESYCKRLVGFPGEVIEIKDGSVWADGNQLIPPDSIRNIQYTSETKVRTKAIWGVSPPAKLAEEEYFVLGDFSANSNDSRFWRKGVPRHNPYALPESHIQGVATHIYWPPQRWCMLR